MQEHETDRAREAGGWDAKRVSGGQGGGEQGVKGRGGEEGDEEQEEQEEQGGRVQFELERYVVLCLNSVFIVLMETN
jgi:hypothetical protein